MNNILRKKNPAHNAMRYFKTDVCAVGHGV